jgi:5-formyltetrahydrofolate cyclo-ligase
MSHNHSQALRARVLHKRCELSHEFVTEASQLVASRIVALTAFEDARVVAAYSAFKNEIDPLEILKTALSAEKQALLPVLVKGKKLNFAPFRPDEASCENRYGIKEPACKEGRLVQINSVGLILVPLVCFDRNCNRIGMGAGYYDRTLADASENRPIKIGLAYEMQRIDSVPVHPWDIALDLVVTEKEIYERS